jgi:protein-disulfide isomerase
MSSSKYLFPAIFLVFIGLLWNFFPLDGTSPKKQFTTEERSEIEAIVHEYLVTNPQVLIEASQVLQRKAMEEQQLRGQSVVSENLTLLLSPHSPSLGNPKGNIVLIEFLDYQCVHCKQMEPVVSQLIENNPSLRVVIKELPIFGEDSTYAAKAALAAFQQEKFADFHEALLTEKEKLTKEKVDALAENHEVDLTLLSDPIIQNHLRESLQLATQLSLRGTPYFILVKDPGKETEVVHIIPGAASREQLQQLIDSVSKDAVNAPVKGQSVGQ